MSLVLCSECGHEVSTEAEICPNCGKPNVRPVPQNVVITRPAKTNEFPKWIIFPIAIVGVMLLFFVFLMLQRNDETANSNMNVKVSGTPITKVVTDKPEPREVIMQPNSNPKEVVVTEPNSAPPITIPSSEQTPTNKVIVPNKAVVKVSAKVFAKNGTPRPVTREKFYLLDKDLSSILADAKIDDESGQDLKTVFALSVIDPSKYQETNRKALAAIKKHIVYSTLTDNQGKAEMKEVKPDNYYLFAISATPNSYAIWDSQITIEAGENELVLEPQTLTEVIIETNKRINSFEE